MGCLTPERFGARKQGEPCLERRLHCGQNSTLGTLG